MSGLELIKTAFNRNKVERTPWVPFVGCHGGALIGVDAKNYLTSEENMYLGVKTAIEKYKADGIPVTFDLQIEAECLGCELKWSDKNPPAVVSHPLTTGKSLHELEIPGPNDGRVPQVMNVARRLRQDCSDVALYGLITGPFTLALHLLGTDIFMKMFEDPNYVFDLLAFCCEVSKAMAGYYMQAGCHVVAVVDPMTSQIGEEQFKQFVSRPVTRVFEHIREHDCLSSFFVCGYSQHNINAMCECRPDNICVDENVPLDFLRDAAQKHQISFGGNLKLTQVLLLGDEEDSRHHALECIDISKGEGFILAPGCDLPYDTPPANLTVVAELVNDPYVQQITRTIAVHHHDEQLPDMTDYGSMGPVQIDVITLDSESCAPCQYMVEAVKSVAPIFQDKVEWREHAIKDRESLLFMKALGVRNIPTICIDGIPRFVSIIPKQDELSKSIQNRIDEKFEF